MMHKVFGVTAQAEPDLGKNTTFRSSTAARRHGVVGLVAAAAALFVPMVLPEMAHAQTEKPLLETPLYPVTVDGNGVNALNGTITFSHTIALGPETGGVRYDLVYDSSIVGYGSANWGWRDSTTGSKGCYIDYGLPEMYQKHSVTVDGDSRVLESGASERIATDEPLPSSRPLSPGSGYMGFDAANADLIYHKGDGAVVEFTDPTYLPEHGCNLSNRIGRIVRPSGEIITYHYNMVSQPPFTSPFIDRIVISSNLGYQIRISSQTRGSVQNERECIVFEGEQSSTYHPRCITSVVLVDTSIDNCPLNSDCLYSRSWPSLSVTYVGSNSLSITDAEGRSTTYTSSMVNGTKRFTSVKAPDGRTRQITYSSVWAGGEVQSITQGAATWTYAYSRSNSPHESFVGTVSATDPTSRTTVYETKMRWGGFGTPTPYLSSITEPGGAVTRYEWFGYHRYRPKSILYPSGRRIDYAYDERHNLTSVTQSPAGGGAPIQVAMGYDAVCANMFTCNQPNYRIDARGNRTDFTYDAAHGGVLSVLGPAAGSGPYATVRPQTSYEYDSGGLGIARLIRTRTCATAQTCTGTANESVVETLYDAKRRPVRTGSRAGDWAATTLSTADARSIVSSVTYSALGDVATIDGPLPGDVDTTRTYYNAVRQPILTVSPDPDGSGPLPRLMGRVVYDNGGRPIREEGGTGAAIDGTDFSLTRFTRSTYDPTSGLLTKVEEVLP